MMRFIEMFYADPLLKFLVDTTMKSFVIFAVAGVFAFCLRHKIGGGAWFRLEPGNHRMPHYPAVFARAPEVGTRYSTGSTRFNCIEPIVNKAGIVNTNRTDTASTQPRDQSEWSSYCDALDRLDSNSLGRCRTVSFYPFDCRDRCYLACLCS